MTPAPSDERLRDSRGAGGVVKREPEQGGRIPGAGRGRRSGNAETEWGESRRSGPSGRGDASRSWVCCDLELPDSFFICPVCGMEQGRENLTFPPDQEPD